MEDKELKKRLEKFPDVDKNGDPIYKIADERSKKITGKKSDKSSKR